MPRSAAPRLTRALQHRNFRLFFSGQSISLIGTWITRVATGWLIYRLTRSELLLGVAGFCGQIPTLLIAPFAGVVVDRVHRQHLLLITQTASLVQVALLASLTLSGLVTVTQLVILLIVQGTINAFDTPARQAFISEMIDDRRDLPNAIALNSSMVNGSRILGPSIGGVLIALVGEGWCFAVNAFTYLAVIAALAAMKVKPRASTAAEMKLLEELTHGWKYVFHSVPLRSVLVLLAIVSAAGTPYTVLMPVIAAQVLEGGPHTLGILMTSTGVGALGGALYLASRESVVGLGRIIMYAALTFGAALVIFALTDVLWFACVILAVAGTGFMVHLAASNTILQTIVEERLRGRVMSFYTMAFFGTVPIGSLIGGVIAERFGAPVTVGLSGAVCIAAGLWFAYRLPAIRAVVRPIYVERGIIPVPAVDTGAKTL